MAGRKFMPYGRRKQHRRAAKKALKKSQKRFLKTYNYKFMLPQQVIVSSQATGGQFNVYTDGTKAVPGPVLQSNLVTAASLTGFVHNTDVGWSSTFKLSDCENFSKYVDLYDAYKINSVTLKLEYLNNVAAAGSSGVMPTAYLAMDQDSAVAPTNIQSVQGYQGCIRKKFGADGRTLSFKFRPYISLGTQRDIGPTITAHSVVQKAPWLDCLQSDVPHYAIKCWMTDLYAVGNSTGSTGFRLQWIYDISFRSPTDVT